jgi:hypothetical protein
VGERATPLQNSGPRKPDFAPCQSGRRARSRDLALGTWLAFRWAPLDSRSGSRSQSVPLGCRPFHVVA